MDNNQTKRPNDMNKEELIELVNTMSMWALDLAQHLDWTTNALKVQYKKEAYLRAIQMAWQICYAWEYNPIKDSQVTIALFGEDGLSVSRGDFGELIDGTMLPVATIEKEKAVFTEFEEIFQEVEGALISKKELENREKALKFWRGITDNKVNKNKIEVSVRSVRRMLWPMEYILELAKNSMKLIMLMRGEIDKLKRGELNKVNRWPYIEDESVE